MGRGSYSLTSPPPPQPHAPTHDRTPHQTTNTPSPSPFFFSLPSPLSPLKCMRVVLLVRTTVKSACEHSTPPPFSLLPHTPHTQTSCARGLSTKSPPPLFVLARCGDTVSLGKAKAHRDNANFTPPHLSLPTCKSTQVHPSPDNPPPPEQTPNDNDKRSISNKHSNTNIIFFSFCHSTTKKGYTHTHTKHMHSTHFCHCAKNIIPLPFCPPPPSVVLFHFHFTSVFVVENKKEKKYKRIFKINIYLYSSK